jgi:hypothetical protein
MQPHLFRPMPHQKIDRAENQQAIRPMSRQDARQPSSPMIVCHQGSSRIAPAPTPEKAMLIASPRCRRNQCGS